MVVCLGSAPVLPRLASCAAGDATASLLRLAGAALGGEAAADAGGLESCLAATRAERRVDTMMNQWYLLDKECIEGV